MKKEEIKILSSSLISEIKKSHKKKTDQKSISNQTGNFFGQIWTKSKIFIPGNRHGSRKRVRLQEGSTGDVGLRRVGRLLRHRLGRGHHGELDQDANRIPSVDRQRIQA